MYKLVVNKIRCKFCGDIIESTSVHDFKTCKCGKCSVDGGLEYAHRNFDGDNPEAVYEDLSLYHDSESGRVIKSKDMNPSDIPTQSIPEVTEESKDDEPEKHEPIVDEIVKVSKTKKHHKDE